MGARADLTRTAGGGRRTGRLLIACGAASLIAGCAEARDADTAASPGLVQASTERSDTLDRGIGILAFDHEGPAGVGGAGADTLLIFRDTTSREIVARYIFRGDASSWGWTVESTPPVEDNSIEFEYEIQGLPVDRVSDDGRWVVVVYGRDLDGGWKGGWARVTPGRTRFTGWPSVLSEQALFFDDGIEPAFFGSPRGEPVEFALEADGGTPGRANYIMHPMQVQGDWMQVRVASPSDYCASLDDPPVRQTMAWIRFLDERGRPRVWYYTRGC